MKIPFWVDHKPAAYSRSAAVKKFTPENVAIWRRAVQVEFWAKAGTWYKPFKGPVKLTVEFTGSMADADNLAKEVMDALNGVAYVDDGQVRKLEITITDRELTPEGRPEKLRHGKAGAYVVIEHLAPEAAIAPKAVRS